MAFVAMQLVPRHISAFYALASAAGSFRSGEWMRMEHVSAFAPLLLRWEYRANGAYKCLCALASAAKWYGGTFGERMEHISASAPLLLPLRSCWMVRIVPYRAEEIKSESENEGSI